MTTLREWMTDTDPARLPAAADLARTLASAVAARHAAAGVHGRLSPEAVILGADGRLEIAPPSATGGDLYTAPECLRGAKATKRADLFALGLLMNEIMTSTHPFAGESAAETLERTLFSGPTGLPGGDWGRMLGKCLAKEPSRRYRAATAIVRDIEAMGKVPAAVVPPVETPTKTEPPKVVARVAKPRPAPPIGAVARQRITEARWFPVAAVLLFVAFASVAYVGYNGFADDRELREIAALIHAGQFAAADTRLAAAQRGAHAKDPALTKLRADLACARNQTGACLKAYAAVFDADPSLRRDPEVATRLLAMLDRGTLRPPALRVLARLDERFVPDLQRRVSSRSFAVRWNAVEVLATMGRARTADYVAAYAEDLRHSDSCRRRRLASKKLGALGDPAALEALEDEQRRVEGSFLERICVGNTAKRAIRQLMH